MASTRNKPDDEEQGDESVACLAIPPERLTDPLAYREASTALMNAILTGQIKSTDAKRRLDLIREFCEMNTGVALEDIARQQMDPLERFRGKMEDTLAELAQVEQALALVDSLRMGPDEKKKWLGVIERLKAAISQAQADPVKCWVYVGRDDENGRVFQMARHHIDFFDTWNDPLKPHSLVMAPVGHSKSTSLRGQMIYEMGTNPALRCLYITGDTPGASKTVVAIKKVMKSPRFRALFPDVRVLGRADASEDSSMRFTVTRANWMSREPTFEGAAIFSNIQGNRYDRIYGDDVCPESVRDQPNIRRRVVQTWLSVVEARIADPKTARIRLICTPWHDEDVAGQIARDAARGVLRDWRVEIDRFAIHDDPVTGKAIPLWNKFSSAFLEDRKIRDGVNYTFKYRLRAASSSDILVRKCWYYNGDPQCQLTTDRDREILDGISQSERWLSLDPAGTGGRQSSDSGMVDIVISPNGYVFVTDCEFYHCSPPELLEKLCDRIATATGAGYQGLQIEAQGAITFGIPLFTKQLLDMLAARGYTRRLDIVTQGARVGGRSYNASKAARLRDCAGYIDHGLIRFAGTRTVNKQTREQFFRAIPNSNIAKLTESILKFDGSSGADAVDALTQWILHNRGRIKKPEDAKPTVQDTPRKLTMGERMGRLLAEQMDALFNAEPPSVGAEEDEFMAKRGVA